MLHGLAVARNYIETSYSKHWIQPKLQSIWESGRLSQNSSIKLYSLELEVEMPLQQDLKR